MLTVKEAEDIIEKLSSKCLRIETKVVGQSIIITGKDFTGHINITPCIHKHIIVARNVTLNVDPKSGYLVSNMELATDYAEIKYCNHCFKVVASPIVKVEDYEDVYNSTVADDYIDHKLQTQS